MTETTLFPGVAFVQPTHLGKLSDDGSLTKPSPERANMPNATTCKSTKNIFQNQHK